MLRRRPTAPLRSSPASAVAWGRRALPVAAVVLLLTAATRADWPAWRGADQTWASHDVPATLPARPKLLWKRQLPGQAYAGIVVSGQTVITANYDRDAARDVILAFHADTGKPIWTHSYANPHNKIKYGPAPRATPLIHGDHVYTVGAAGEVRCLQLATGRLVWRTNYLDDFQAAIPQWGFSSTPIIVDGKLIVSPGGKTASIAALDPRTGKVLWHGAGKGINYASLIAGTFGGVPQVIGYTTDELRGWAVKDGKTLWSIPVDREWVGASCFALGEKLLAADEFSARVFAFGEGGRIIREPLAESDEFTMLEANGPVLVDGVLIGTAGGMGLMAVDVDLKQVWLNEDEDGFFGFSTVFAGDGRILLFDEMGVLHLVSVNRKACKAIGSAKLCGRKGEELLAAPALCAGRFYCHDDTTLYAYEIPRGSGGPDAGK